MHPQTEHMSPLALLVKAAISVCPKAMAATLLSKIFVCGDGGRFRGLAERLELELRQLFPAAQVNVQMCAPNAGWIGEKLVFAGFCPKFCFKIVFICRCQTICFYAFVSRILYQFCRHAKILQNEPSVLLTVD
jgi:hypothetical protein